MVYVREAHPSDGWRMEVNDRLGVTVPQPRTYDERAGVAQTCSKALGLGFPMVVDTIDDSVNKRYSGIPSRLYLIDGEGKIAYKSGRGPFGFKPSELEHSLLLLLQHERAAATFDKADQGQAGKPVLRTQHERAAATLDNEGRQPRELTPGRPHNGSR
jgi:hypothetical protein